ncbi:hypothetical protein N658DRAFT_307329 [Parathielavia hyrcaniae]|uniref:Uncharacterized protein n=1 Tax=Parathielavia hyrcaniae TaxID=113614 RepID=A0AAN6Q498_9PEZI|nr:hypothetical protein N658DRAFT_307329 [Parathielavia hyrcaniae]
MRKRAEAGRRLCISHQTGTACRDWMMPVVDVLSPANMGCIDLKIDISLAAGRGRLLGRYNHGIWYDTVKYSYQVVRQIWHLAGMMGGHLHCCLDSYRDTIAASRPFLSFLHHSSAFQVSSCCVLLNPVFGGAGPPSKSRASRLRLAKFSWQTIAAPAKAILRPRVHGRFLANPVLPSDSNKISPGDSTSLEVHSSGREASWDNFHGCCHCSPVAWSYYYYFAECSGLAGPL